VNVGDQVRLTERGAKLIKDRNRKSLMPIELPRQGSIGWVSKLPISYDRTPLWEVNFPPCILCSEEMIEPWRRPRIAKEFGLWRVHRQVEGWDYVDAFTAFGAALKFALGGRNENHS